jgi:hypothetical protein
MANYVKGTLINLFYHNGTSYVPFAYSQSNGLESSSETTQISSKDHGLHPDTEVTSSSFSMSGEYFFTPDNAKIILDMQRQGKAFSFCFAQTAETNFADGLKDVTGIGSQESYTPGTTFVQYGNALITSASISANNGEVATVSITATGSGALSDSAPETPVSYSKTA